MNELNETESLASPAEFVFIRPMTKRQRVANLIAILLGLAATMVVLSLHVHGALERLEMIAVDLRFRHANSIHPGDRIVCLDITDRDLESIGRWPWPRDLQAPLISAPAEMGAEAILVDITWTEPEAVRSRDPEHADILSPPSVLATETLLERVLPDSVLRNAIASAGNAYLAYHHAAVDLVRGAAFRELVDLVKREKVTEAAELAAHIDARLRKLLRDDKEYALQRPLDRARIAAALLPDPTLSEGALAKLLGFDDAVFLVQAVERCRAAVLRWKLRDWFDAEPSCWRRPPAETAREFFATLTDAHFTDESPFKHAVILAVREVLSYAATTARPVASLEAVSSAARGVDGLTPVHFLHADAARRCCFANFEPDLDGTVRRVALIRRHGEVVLGQLGFLAGWDLLDVDPGGVSVQDGLLTLRPKNPGLPPLTIQLDERGRTLIPWVRGREWTRQFEHVPASAVLRLNDLRENAAKNRAEATAFIHLVCSSEFLPQFNEVADLLAKRPAVQRQAEMEALHGDAELAEFFESQLAQIDREADQAEVRLTKFVDEQQALLRSGDSTAETTPEPIIQDVRYFLGEVRRLHDARLDNERKIELLTQRLRSIFSRKICVVGYAATSLADMVPIPTHPRAPGFMAHANLLNGMLTGQLMREASPALDATLIFGLGVLTTLIASFFQPRMSLLLVIFLAVSFTTIGGALVFYRWHYVLDLTSPLTAALLSYVLIAVYRYIFVEGERRQLATALGQYTSKEMARQMAENPELCRKAEMREVTSVFTDLKDFTTISEKIGAERTQKVLNITLGCFTEVMLRYEGMVNKFIGDGVFAFWNPVIYPQKDHARRACDTAIDLLVALEKLKLEQKRAGGDDIFKDIILRIGLATGNAVVGPCGSEQKYDYTCIGDSVNLAARLESGNKFYGTQILVNGVTRDQAGDEFEFRSLGGVRVKGKKLAVPVYELLGRTGQVAEQQLQYARDFGEAIQLFQQRKWKIAIQALDKCSERRPDDLAAENYRQAAAHYLTDPPGDDWTGGIELREK